MPSDDDVELVTRLYERCWQKSKGRYNKWIPGKLNRSEFTFYLVLNAHERTMMDGALAIVDHDDRFRDPATGFTLAATADAFQVLGCPAQAAAIRELARIFPNGEVPTDREWLDAYMTRAGERDPDVLDRVHALFYEDDSSKVEDQVYARLAQFARQHPEDFDLPKV